MITDRNFSRVETGEKVKDRKGRIYRYTVLNGERVFLHEEKFIHRPEEFLSITGSGLPFFDLLKTA